MLEVSGVTHHSHKRKAMIATQSSLRHYIDMQLFDVGILLNLLPAMHFAITPILLLAAFIFLLVVSLSVPVFKHIYFLRLLDASHGQEIIRLGAWGYCTPITS